MVDLSLLAQQCAPLMLYHGCFDTLPGDLRLNLHNVVPEVLHRQLSLLKQHFRFVSIDEMARAGQTPGLAALSFDDAYNVVNERALPILLDLDIPVTIFVNSCTLEGHIFWRDKVRYIINNNLVDAWEQATAGRYGLDNLPFYRYSKDPRNNSLRIDHELEKLLASRGVTGLTGYCYEQTSRFVRHPLVSYGNHSRHHYVMSSLSRQQQAEEIAHTTRLLDAVPGLQRCGMFSIPFGQPRDFNNDTIELVAEMGFDGVLLSRSRVNQPNDTGVWQKLRCLERFMPDESDIAEQLVVIDRDTSAAKRRGE